MPTPIPLLVIDDDTDFVSGMVALLEGRGYRVFTAADGDTAWELIQTGKPEVVLVDWNMPGLDGLQLIRRMRAEEAHRGRYAIMVTARSGRGDIITGMDAGANDYLTKPFDNDELLARIKVGIRTCLLERELAEQVRRATVLEMAGSVAHEIGNPLAGAKLLQLKILNRPEVQALPEVRRDLEDLGSELHRIELLVRKAQHISRVRSKPYAGDLRIIDFDEKDAD
jgi:sigma-B regulation protein RsbU (phosphoserine phosphatase)